MARKKPKNHISVGFWMWMLFVTALPIIGQIMTVVWAFSGDNESRKNYFRAVLIWFLILLTICLVAMTYGVVSGWKGRQSFGQPM